MRALCESTLLELWERGLSQGPATRALALLSAATPETSFDALASLSIGRRDAELLSLRESMFGSRLDCVAQCPQCGEGVEFFLGVADLRVDAPAPAREAAPLTHEAYRLWVRPPNGLDLMEIEKFPDAARRRCALFERCLLAAQCDGQDIGIEQLPASLVDAAEIAMAEADPQADIALQIACPACAHHWPAILDIASYLWCEIHAWATRMLREIHVLASAYGWREQDILALSAARRRIYLELASG